MKNILILHGTGSNSQGNWFPWLADVMEQQGWKVWAPNLPGAEKPNMKTYTDHLLGNTEWKFNEQSVIVGHSSGAVAGLGLLNKLEEGKKIGTYIGVGAFHTDLNWESLKELFVEPLNYERIKGHAAKFIFIHSDNDPHVPVIEAEYLARALNGELIIKKGQGHFNLTRSPEYKEFPFLLETILNLRTS
ncbi:MAG: alpha/beta hydrolase [bacterium]|nr:alpha/beta hydrolase [bacterium]